MSFWELLVVAVVGLLVIGPDKLPETIKSGLIWVRRVRRMVNETRSEIEQQLGVDEIKREIHNQEVLESLRALNLARQSAENELNSIGESAQQLKAEIREEFAPEDEGLFGDQRANHPLPPPETPAVTPAKSDKAQS